MKHILEIEEIEIKNFCITTEYKGNIVRIKPKIDLTPIIRRTERFIIEIPSNPVQNRNLYVYLTMFDDVEINMGQILQEEAEDKEYLHFFIKQSIKDMAKFFNSI